MGETRLGVAGAAGGDRILAGILLALGSYGLFNLGDTTAKFMTYRLPVPQVAWAEFMFMLVISLLLARGRRLGATVRTAHPWLQLARGTLTFVSTLIFFTALRYLPLADVISISFVSPFFITILASLLLGERVGAVRWVACIAGFAGALVILRPGFAVTSWAAALPLGSALCYALYAIATRRLGPTENASTMLFFSGVVGAAATSVIVPLVWVAPTPAEWALLAGIGLLNGAAQLLMIRAYSLAPASLIAPFSYVEIIGAVGLGYLVFADLPGPWTWAGAAVIVGSGLVVYRSEVRRPGGA